MDEEFDTTWHKRPSEATDSKRTFCNAGYAVEAMLSGRWAKFSIIADCLFLIQAEGLLPIAIEPSSSVVGNLSRWPETYHARSTEASCGERRVKRALSHPPTGKWGRSPAIRRWGAGPCFVPRTSADLTTPLSNHSP